MEFFPGPLLKALFTELYKSSQHHFALVYFSWGIHTHCTLSLIMIEENVNKKIKHTANLLATWFIIIKIICRPTMF